MITKDHQSWCLPNHVVRNNHNSWCTIWLTQESIHMNGSNCRQIQKSQCSVQMNLNLVSRLPRLPTMKNVNHGHSENAINWVLRSINTSFEYSYLVTTDAYLKRPRKLIRRTLNIHFIRYQIWLSLKYYCQMSVIGKSRNDNRSILIILLRVNNSFVLC